MRSIGGRPEQVEALIFGVVVRLGVVEVDYDDDR